MEGNKFDQDFDENEVWEKIESRISAKRSRTNTPKTNYWLVAATFTLLLTVGWLAYDRANLTDQIIAMEEVKVEGNSYQQIESYYIQTIRQKRDELNSSAAAIEYPISADLDTLKIQYDALKEQVKEQGVNEKVVNAMILNLRTQIDLLNVQLSIIESLNEYMNAEKNKENDTQI